MLSTSTACQTTPHQTEKERLKKTWMAGDYDTFSRYMEEDAMKFFERLEIPCGAKVLDIGCGAGQLALIAARRGAKVTGCDIATNWLEKARARARHEGLEIVFEEGDAESLPYRDAEFDAVVSLIAAMFAPHPDLVAAEMTRVCRPGGTIAMASWTPDGFVGQMFKAISKYIAPPGMPSPLLWGDPGIVRERFRDGVAGFRFARQQYRLLYPFPPADVVEFFRINYGPMTRAFESLDPGGQAELRNDLVALWSAYNKAEGNATDVDGEYLEVIAARSDPSHNSYPDR